MVQSEYEAPIDHDPQVVDSAHYFAIVTRNILSLPVIDEVVTTQGLEADEYAPHPRRGGLLEEPGAQHCINGRGGLPHRRDDGGQRLLPECFSDSTRVSLRWNIAQGADGFAQAGRSGGMRAVAGAGEDDS